MSQGETIGMEQLASRRDVGVIENVAIARDTHRIRLDDPGMAAAILPGHFLMIRPDRGFDPLLGRPFALFDVAVDGRGRPSAVDVVYQVVGKGTAGLAKLRPGDRVIAWGPLGRGFGPPADGPAAFVAGGIGQTPFLALGKWWGGVATYGGTSFAASGSRQTLYYGVRSASFLAGVAEFRAAGVEVEVATDDGTAGHRGFVTDLLIARLDRGERPARVVGCGPSPMLASLAGLAAARGLDCDVSLENHMAGGFGACFSCVAPIRQGDGSVDLRRVCVEGPVFRAGDVVFGPASRLD